ncbi:MAG: hypothetical protein CMQ41_03665 [Gammaproteobacteria bacterium]|nr:hypothetical protein [Gammaproteobacteria bacterium]
MRQAPALLQAQEEVETVASAAQERSVESRYIRDMVGGRQDDVVGGQRPADIAQAVIGGGVCVCVYSSERQQRERGRVPITNTCLQVFFPISTSVVP